MLFAMLQPLPHRDECKEDAGPPSTTMANDAPPTCEAAPEAVASQRLGDLARELVPRAEALEMSCNAWRAAGGSGANGGRVSEWESPRCACFDECATRACDGRDGNAMGSTPQPPRKKCDRSFELTMCRRRCSFRNPSTY